MSDNATKSKLEREITELTESLGRVVTTFKSMRAPLIESQGKVPQATVQLDKVVDQTEAAATGMLDTLERITQREERVIDDLRAFRSEIGNWQPEESRRAVDSIINRAEANLNDVYHVMDALQFQDITSQQIQHAAAVLEDVEFKLKNIIAVMSGENDQTGICETQKVRVFDPHADLYARKTAQADVDNLFARTEES